MSTMASDPPAKLSPKFAPCRIRACHRSRPANLPRGFATYTRLMEQLNIKLPAVPRTVSEAMKAFREYSANLQTAEVDRHAAPFRNMIFDVLARFDEVYRESK